MRQIFDLYSETKHLKASFDRQINARFWEFGGRWIYFWCQNFDRKLGNSSIGQSQVEVRRNCHLSNFLLETPHYHVYFEIWLTAEHVPKFD